MPTWHRTLQGRLCHVPSVPVVGRFWKEQLRPQRPVRRGETEPCTPQAFSNVVGAMKEPHTPKPGLLPRPLPRDPTWTTPPGPLAPTLTRARYSCGGACVCTDKCAGASGLRDAPTPDPRGARPSPVLCPAPSPWPWVRPHVKVVQGHRAAGTHGLARCLAESAWTCASRLPEGRSEEDPIGTFLREAFGSGVPERQQ